MSYIIVIETCFKIENSIKIFFIKKKIDQIRFIFVSKITCAHLDLKGNYKYHKFSAIKDTFPLVLSK